MQEFYQIDDQPFKLLNLSVEVLYRSMSKFNHCGGMLGLYFYIDENKHLKSQIAQAILNSLETKDQLDIYEYLEYANNNYQEE